MTSFEIFIDRIREISKKDPDKLGGLFDACDFWPGGKLAKCDRLGILFNAKTGNAISGKHLTYAKLPPEFWEGMRQYYDFLEIEAADQEIEF